MAESQKELTALIVDDQSSMRVLLERLLYIGFPSLNIQTVTEGGEAYNIIKKKKPDILYTDVNMKDNSGEGMDGHILLQKLVEEGVYIPTVVLSADMPSPEAVAALFYSGRMYTPKQRQILGINLQPDIESQRQELYRSLAQQRMQAPDPTRIHYDYSFTGLAKPFKREQFLDRTRRIVELYN